MIDHPEQTKKLITEIEAHLPIEARLSSALKGMLQRQMSLIFPSDQCQLVDVFYAGDEGGIACRLDLASQEADASTIVSLTHLIFEKRCPLYRQIDRYQKHRVKKLKKQNGRGF
ncbi:MAG: hypothetical protein NXH94_20770 [Rhodobacteraceae bacterium]|nr:hypothetical protein [Paracoccaceae bacterium]